jgi:hypothetical protein
LLPVPYYHVVFTLPARIADIAYQNKAVIYDLLFKASSETMLTIAADPKHLGARIGILSVLHSCGSAMTHHPHVALSRPLHPPGRHLKPPLDRMRPERRHLQVEGLQARRSRALSGDDACRPRVHPPLSHARTARRLSTASATMACSPAAIAPRTSPALANCSCRQSFPSMPSRQLAPSCSAAER